MVLPSSGDDVRADDRDDAARLQCPIMFTSRTGVKPRRRSVSPDCLIDGARREQVTASLPHRPRRARGLWRLRSAASSAGRSGGGISNQARRSSSVPNSAATMSSWSSRIRRSLWVSAGAPRCGSLLLEGAGLIRRDNILGTDGEYAESRRASSQSGISSSISPSAIGCLAMTGSGATAASRCRRRPRRRWRSETTTAGNICAPRCGTC